jgi:poly-gamma-glutamate biosynthesis protein PgsC/CapC
MLTASLVTGVLVSLLLTELIGLSAGGVIVPGYVALLLDRPISLIGFILAALLSYGLVRWLSNYLMLYGNRRFSLILLIGMTLSIAAQWFSPALTSAHLEWAGIGFIVPGLLGHQFDRQGIVPSLLMLTIASVITRLCLLMIVRL